MPRMDGLTFARHVRNHPVHKFTPIIMLTTESQESKKEEGKAAGVRAWITKPLPAVATGRRCQAPVSLTVGSLA